MSDDFTLTRVLKEAKLPVHFTPHCLVASVGDCNFRELLEFTTRQIKITRVYSPQLWLPLLLGSALFTIVFFGGIVLLGWRIMSGRPFVVLLLVLCILFALGAAKSFIRWRIVVGAALRGRPCPISHAGAATEGRPYNMSAWKDLIAHTLLWPFASLLYLYNAIAAGFSRRITWRGITYELKSPSEAVIISREP